MRIDVRMWLAAMAVVVGACAGPGPGSDDRDTTSTGAGGPAGQPSGSAPGWTRDGAIDLPAAATTAAVTLAAIERSGTGGAEAVRLTFADAAGAAAVAPRPARAELRLAQAVVRVWLAAGVKETAVTERRFDAGLVRDVFVVRAPEGGGFFVDVHVREGAEVRLERDDAGALVVALRTMGADPIRGAPQGERVVVLAPRGGTVAQPIAIEGYGRAFEATIAIELRRDGRAVLDTFTTASDWSSAWGAFRLALERVPPGPAELFVGEHSAEDGRPIGVTIPIEVAP